ncbi:hypothetical protein ACN42_g11469 [Penicillium freii]|uniref:Uncharacterized protein n=1 Tax=Penicillium freii TaxID=48697 RepID=A0A101M835_PENFR|nr:hypothetical protein ACN42_g11469 [Penicillium freii]
MMICFTTLLISTKDHKHRYNDKELWFIWYKRAALGERWNDILMSFNCQFPGRQRLYSKTYVNPNLGSTEAALRKLRSDH